MWRPEGENKNFSIFFKKKQNFLSLCNCLFLKGLPASNPKARAKNRFFMGISQKYA
jgi:hypothetical protein